MNLIKIDAKNVPRFIIAGDTYVASCSKIINTLQLLNDHFVLSFWHV